jgi:uncharacterized SAM-binding protein YcdF (DUF218 family)
MPQEYIASSPNHYKVGFLGIFTRKERWGLSWRGCLVVAFAVLTMFGVIVIEIHPFLAETQRVDSNTLVVEGWINEHAIKLAVKEFKDGHYERVFTTGGPVEGSGGYISDAYTLASVGAGRLKKFGVPAELLQMVPSRVLDRDRTYGSAVALRNWLSEHNMRLHSINVLTSGAHARRTRLLFQAAFGDDVKVGVISIPSPDYDANHWWRYSEGVREIIGEAIAYIYAQFFFHPTESERRGTTNSSPSLIESPKSQ